MKSHYEKYKLVLICGLVFVLGGINILIAQFSPLDGYSFLVVPSILLAIGIVIVYFSVLGKKSLFSLILGFLLFSAWLFFLLIFAELIPYSVSEFWPAMSIFIGAMLIPIAFIKYGFLPITFLLSAIVLVVLGGTFLLFSLDIIEMSFSEFASIWWPILIIAGGVALLSLFFYTRKHKKEVWIKDIEEDEDLK